MSPDEGEVATIRYGWRRRGRRACSKRRDMSEMRWTASCSCEGRAARQALSEISSGSNLLQQSGKLERGPPATATARACSSSSRAFTMNATSRQSALWPYGDAARRRSTLRKLLLWRWHSLRTMRTRPVRRVTKAREAPQRRARTYRPIIRRNPPTRYSPYGRSANSRRLRPRFRRAAARCA